jgi:hypothetical protein
MGYLILIFHTEFMAKRKWSVKDIDWERLIQEGIQKGIVKVDDDGRVYVTCKKCSQKVYCDSIELFTHSVIDCQESEWNKKLRPELKDKYEKKHGKGSWNNKH